jgi:hypothetical protein
LESSDFGVVKFGGGVFCFGELRRRTVEWLGPGRGSMLGAAFGRVFKASEGFGDVARHGEIDSAGFVVVPFESDAPVEGAGTRCWAFSLPVYWTPKLWRTRLNMTGRVSCLKRPGVCAQVGGIRSWRGNKERARHWQGGQLGEDCTCLFVF